MVRLVRPWSYTVYTQAEDRVHRIGSERHEVINYIDYVTEDTVEEVQLIRLNSKEARAQEVLRDRDLLELLKKVNT
jgi:SNF2 family DNA or RNA helicase